MTASQKQILRVIAHWELVEGAERDVPHMKGFAKVYLARLSANDIATINAYRKEKAAISRTLADMLA